MDKYLNDDFGEKFAQSFLFDIAAEVLVAESQFEFQSFWHVGDARVGPLFGVQFAGEDAVGLDTDDHVGRSAIDSDIVTRRQLVRCRLRNFQIGILILRPTATTKYPNWIEIEKSTTAESFLTRSTARLSPAWLRPPVYYCYYTWIWLRELAEWWLSRQTLSPVSP